MSRLRSSGLKFLWVAPLCLMALSGPLGDARAAHTPDGKPRESSDDLFTNSAIRHVAIEISPDGMNTLRQYRWRGNGDNKDRPVVPATVREGGAVFTNVAIHLKGSSGSFRPVDSKPALTLNFDKWADGQRFHGLQKISLNNSPEDPSFLSEKICREMFARAGIPVPRADHATVTLNGRSLGLYVLVEGWDKQFLKRFFKNTGGNLYEGGLHMDLNSSLHVSSGDRREDRSAIDAVLDAATERDPTHRLARLDKVIDLDRFITLLALDVILWNWDGYAMAKNNFRLFHDLDAKRVVFLPHGLDEMFWNPTGPIMTGTKGVVARAVLSAPEGRRRYLERFRRLRAEVFDEHAVARRVDELAARIRPAVAEGGLIDALGHHRAVAELRSHILTRARSIDAQLAGMTNLLRLASGETASLSGWKSRTRSGSPGFNELDARSDALHIKTGDAAVGAWFTTVWLEEGRYVVEARVKTRGVTPLPNDPRGGASLRVFSQRKQTEGLNWGWFGNRKSGHPETRGEMATLRTIAPRLTGTADWTIVTYDFNLTEPMADLEILCELRAAAGEAWFDLQSLKLKRK